MARIVMDAQELVASLMELANSPSRYSNHYPENVLMYNTDGRWSADCLNLLKALFNGRDIHDRTIGSYQHDLSNTGDVTEEGLINQCEDVSSDFTKLGTMPVILYMKGHMGCYLGEERMVNGRTVNVVEATTAFGGGIVYSYVDASGRRYDGKGGEQLLTWEKYGKPTKWVEYGKADIYKMQTLKYGTKGTIDITIFEAHMKKMGLYNGELDQSFGGGCLAACNEFQNRYPECGTDGRADGSFGPRSWNKLFTIMKG